jgi:HK97 family phage major capsid protein
MSEGFRRDAKLEGIENVTLKDGQATQEVTLSLSSEEPYQRWFGMEVLGHKEGEVDLGRLNNGGALLLNHDTDKQVGAFNRGSVHIGKDKKVRGVARFSRSALAKEVADDVEQGIREHTSIGYRVLEMERARELETVDKETGEVEMQFWRATKWMPLEGSIVPVAADDTVGPNRMLKEENEIVFVDDEPEGNTTVNETERKAKEAADIAAAEAQAAASLQTIDVGKERKEAGLAGATDERERIAEIQAVGEKFQLKPEIVTDAIAKGVPADAFRKAVFDTWSPEAVRTVDPNVGLSPREVKQFSICRAVNALLTNNWAKAGLEQEAIRVAQDKHDSMGLGVEPNSITIPLEVQTAASRVERQMQHRADLIAGGSEGQELVGTDHLGQQFIDALRNRVKVLEAGTTLLTGLIGNVSIPRQVLGIAAGISATELAAYTEGAPTYDNVTLSPKIANAFQPVSRQLLIQGTPDVETMLRRDLTLALGLTLDSQAIYGTGASGQALGIEGQTGVYDLDFAEVTPTWAKVVEGETGIASANADVGDMKWLLHAKARGKFKTTPKEAGGGISDYLWDTRDRDTPMNSYAALISNQLDDATGTASGFNEGVFGVWPQAIMGFWGGMTLLVDPYTLATTHIVRLIIHQHFDFTVRHGEAFAFVVGIEN